MLSCYFRALRLGGVLTSPQAAPSGLQMTQPSPLGTENPGKHGSPDFILIMQSPLNALFSVGTMNADTDSLSEESVKVIQGRVAHGTLYVRLTSPTMDNHNKLSQVPEF